MKCNPLNPPYQGGTNTNFFLNEFLSRHTQFRIGGPARFFYSAHTSVEIAQAINWAKNKKIDYYILGRGTNVLVSDTGFSGLVIENNTKGTKKQGGQIICASGERLGSLVNFALKNKLAELESLTGIPGTVGGAIFGNAGAFGATVSDHLSWVKFYDPAKKKIVKYTKKQCVFSYRGSIFKKNQGIVLEAGFGLNPVRDFRAIQEKIAKIRAVRLRHPYKNCAGSVFKNIVARELPPPPPSSPYPSSGRRGISRAGGEIPSECKQHNEIKVACLIEKLGLKGKTIGGAQISEKHANFIVNKNNASAEDVLALIAFVTKKVYDQYQLVLETEIQMVGF